MFEYTTSQFGQWISVQERLPDNTDHNWVLALIMEDNAMWLPRVMKYEKDKDDWCCSELGWLNDHGSHFTVTHWMPLPETPECLKKI